MHELKLYLSRIGCLYGCVDVCIKTPIKQSTLPFQGSYKHICYRVYDIGVKVLKKEEWKKTQRNA